MVQKLERCNSIGKRVLEIAIYPNVLFSRYVATCYYTCPMWLVSTDFYMIKNIVWGQVTSMQWNMTELGT